MSAESKVAAPVGGVDVLAVMQASADQLWRYRRDILAREEEEASAAVAGLVSEAQIAANVLKAFGLDDKPLRAALAPFQSEAH